MSIHPKDLETVDVIAMLITVGVLGILGYSVVEYFGKTGDGPESGERIKVIILAYMNIVSMYVGSKLSRKL